MWLYIQQIWICRRRRWAYKLVFELIFIWIYDPYVCTYNRDEYPYFPGLHHTPYQYEFLSNTDNPIVENHIFHFWRYKPKRKINKNYISISTSISPGWLLVIQQKQYFKFLFENGDTCCNICFRGRRQSIGVCKISVRKLSEDLKAMRFKKVQ